MDPALIKALLINAAYEGAAAVCQPLINNPDGTQVKLDPLIQDVGLQQKGLLVYEEAKIQYAAILRAFADKTGVWPDPVVSTGVAGAGVSGQVSTGAVSAALQALLSQLPPGSTLTTVSAFLTALAAAASSVPQGTPTPPSAAPAASSK